MRLIKITPTVKLRVKEMVLNLLTEYDYVRVRKTGLVTLKRKWWSLKRDRISVTDLIVGEIPKKIAEIARLGGKGDEYLTMFSSHIASILHISTYSNRFNLVDYVWDKYSDLCLEIPKVSFEFNEFELEEKKEYIALNFFEDTYWMGIIKSLKKQALPPSKGGVRWSLMRHPSIVKRVNTIKNKVL